MIQSVQSTRVKNIRQRPVIKVTSTSCQGCYITMDIRGHGHLVQEDRLRNFLSKFYSLFEL